jgi:methionyl-tRNA formyltransferase
MKLDDDQVKPRVLLLGLGPTAASALMALHERFQIVAMVRQVDPDDETCQLATHLEIPIASWVSVHDVDDLISLLRPDCVVVSSYDRILPPSLLSRCPFVNVRYAPLPLYRGRANVNWLLINRAIEAAVTVECMVPDIDAGGILAQKVVALSTANTVTQVYDKLNAIQRNILADAVELRLQGHMGEPQEEWLAGEAAAGLGA